MLIGIIIFVLFILVLFVIIGISKFSNEKERENFGNKGEENVASMLQAIQQQYKSYIFKGIIFIFNWKINSIKIGKS